MGVLHWSPEPERVELRRSILHSLGITGKFHEVRGVSGHMDASANADIIW